MTTADDLARVLSADTVRVERVLKAKPDRVWSYLVEAEKRKRWFCGGDDIPATPGVAFKTAFNHANITDEKPPEKYKRFDGTQPDLVFTEFVLEYDPPRRLRTGFGGAGDQSPSEVLYELKPEGDYTRLVITHSKLPSRGDMVGVGAGWNSHLDVLEDEFAERRNKDFWTKHARYSAALEEKIPK